VRSYMDKIGRTRAGGYATPAPRILYTRRFERDALAGRPLRKHLENHLTHNSFLETVVPLLTAQPRITL
jgi:hypothetical protein